MTARSQLVGTLQPLMPEGIDVIPYAQQIPRPPQPTVMVRIDRVQPSPTHRLTHRVYTFALVLLASSEDTAGPADDELDGLLEDVLYVLDQGAANEVLPTWTAAERAVYQETVPAYEVACTVIAEKQPFDPEPDPTP